MSMTAYFRSSSEGKLKICTDSDLDCLIVATCDKYGFSCDRVTFRLTSTERDKMIAVLRSLDCTEADADAAEEAA